MKSLTPRERVARAINHQEPDLVPVDIGSTASNFTDIAYLRTKKFLGLAGEGELFRLGENSSTYDETLIQAVGSDFRHAFLRPSQRDWDGWHASDKTCFTDEWRVERRWVPADYGGGNWEKVSYPLAGADIHDLDRFPWPDPHDPARVVGLEGQVRRWATTTDYAISARAVSHGLLETAQELRGLEAFLIDMMTNKAFAHKLFEKILEVQIGLYTALLTAVGPYLQIVTTADDYGSQRGPLISPRLYREMIMPYRQELNRHIRSLAPQVKIQHHTCGSVYKLLPVLIESGIQILNPVQPLAADMDPQKLKAEFGDVLVFHGAIDIQQAMNGSVEDVQAEVQRRIEALAPGGGYIIAPCSNFQADNPPENILAMIAAARQFGKYPIQVA